jgi:DNA-binding transcriptional MocR family regulator
MCYSFSLNTAYNLQAILLVLATFLTVIDGAGLTMSTSSSKGLISTRIITTEHPYIEDVLDKYAPLPNLTMMALGSSYWSPPADALSRVAADVNLREVQRYGNILGYPALRSRVKSQLQSKGLNMDKLDVIITSGANQAFTNLALTICDDMDHAGK